MRLVSDGVLVWGKECLDDVWKWTEKD